MQDKFKGIFFAKGVHSLIDTRRANCDKLSGLKKDNALFALQRQGTILYLHPGFQVQGDELFKKIQCPWPRLPTFTPASRWRSTLADQRN